MVPENEYLKRYLHEAAIAEVSDKYELEGYRVAKEVRIGGTEIDLVVEKDAHKVYFEFKVGKSEEKQREAILHVKRQAEQDDAEFRLVYVAPPPQVTVNVEDIEEKIWSHLEQDMPSEIDELSTHSSIEYVSDVEIADISLRPNSILVKGTFSLTVGLQFGSSSDVRNDIGYESESGFVAEFQAELNGELDIVSLDTHIDTSAWYE